MKILVVDDEALLVKGICFNLENEGYEVETASDGETAVEMAKNNAYDLIIMDLMMPKMNGMDACMQIRTFSSLPIIMLTARSEASDKVMGFECGADDYVTKPFNILELKARVRALLRRAGMTEQKKEDGSICVGILTLKPAERVVLRGGKKVELTAKEYDLLELLMKNPHRVYTRDNLMDLVWGCSYAGDFRTVDVHMRRLREKVEENPAEPKILMTKWGVGYYLDA